MNYSNLPNWQLIAVPVVFIMLSIYYFTKYVLADELIYARYQVEALQRDLQETLELLDAENARAVVAEREVDVIRRANAILRGTERDRQEQLANLQADLAFYRRLGGANGSQAPLAVHYLELQATRAPRVYRLIFTLTQNLRWAAVISGQVQLGVDGIRNGVAQHLTNQQLLAESAEPLNFQFKYFQQLERLITLPEDFAASRLSIRLKSASLRTAVEQSIEWNSLFNQQNANKPSIAVSDASLDD